MREDVSRRTEAVGESAWDGIDGVAAKIEPVNGSSSSAVGARRVVVGEGTRNVSDSTRSIASLAGREDDVSSASRASSSSSSAWTLRLSMLPSTLASLSQRAIVWTLGGAFPRIWGTTRRFGDDRCGGFRDVKIFIPSVSSYLSNPVTAIAFARAIMCCI